MVIIEAPQHIKHKKYGVGKFLKEDTTNRVFSISIVLMMGR